MLKQINKIMDKKEVWKDVKGYEGYYQVSDKGRVKSLKRTARSGFNSYRTLNEKILNPGLNNRGYLGVALYKNNKRTTISVHQLVAIVFLNHTPNGNKDIVDHINGIKTDNELSNLRIVSSRENISTCYRSDKENLSSKFVGVHWHKAINKWVANIRFQGKQKHLGSFNCELDASNAYQNALKQYKNNNLNKNENKWTV